MAENRRQNILRYPNEHKSTKSVSFIGYFLQWKKENAPGIDNYHAVNVLKPLWNNIKLKQKKQYETYAIKLGVVPGDIDFVQGGNLVSCICSIEKKLQQKAYQKIKTNIFQLSKAISKTDFIQKKFYFIHFNHFAKTVDNFLYIPAELGIFEYSIAKSLQRSSYTTHIKPEMNDVLTGIEYEARSHSEKTHKLHFQKDFSDDPLITNLCGYLKNFMVEEPQGIYNLYTNCDDIPIIESCLVYLKKKAKQTLHFCFRVHSIQNLLYCLSSVQSNKNLNICDIERLFEHDAYEYTSGISCAYHEIEDKTKYCSLSIVSRWSFMFDKILSDEPE